VESDPELDPELKSKSLQFHNINSRTLSKTAAVLFFLGHVKPATEVLLELLVRVDPFRLTLEQVGAGFWQTEGGGGEKSFNYSFPMPCERQWARPYGSCA
jgi:hypothetical protein